MEIVFLQDSAFLKLNTSYYIFSLKRGLVFSFPENARENDYIKIRKGGEYPIFLYHNKDIIVLTSKKEKDYNFVFDKRGFWRISNE